VAVGCVDGHELNSITHGQVSGHTPDSHTANLDTPL
jgi:hypothetical protein